MSEMSEIPEIPKMTEINKLSTIIEYNKAHRIHKIPHTAGLVELDDIDYGQIVYNDIGGTLIIPKKHKSITNESDVYYKNRQEKYNNYCINNFSVLFEILNTIPGIALCGGAALWLYNQSCVYRPNVISILTPKHIPKDFDLFIYEEDNLSPEELTISQNNKINEIIRIIIKNNLTVKTYLVKGVITMQLFTKNNNDIAIINKLCIQVILRDYCSISEILHSFDIPCCAIAWDGKKTYLTRLAEWSILNGTNIVMPEYRSNTYELRLIKYFNDKNFSLLLPHLRLSNNNKIVYFTNIIFNIHYVDGNMAIADACIPKLDSLDIVYSSQDKYEEIDYDKVLNDYIIDFYNITYIHKIVQKNCYLIMKNKKYFEKVNYINKNNFYNFVEMGISEIISMESYKKWITAHIKKNIIIFQDEYLLNENFIKETIGENYEKFAEDNNIEKIKLELKKLNEKLLIKKSPKIHGKIFILNTLINNFILYMISLYESRNEEVLNFNIILNRDIPLTGALHPSGQSCKEWYGENYIESNKITKYKTIKTFIDIHISNILKDLKICPLCFEQIHYLSENIITLKCGHIYHECADDTCGGIYKWFEKHSPPSCPECRTKFPKKLLEF